MSKRRFNALGLVPVHTLFGDRGLQNHGGKARFFIGHVLTTVLTCRVGGEVGTLIEMKQRD